VKEAMPSLVAVSAKADGACAVHAICHFAKLSAPDAFQCVLDWLTKNRVRYHPGASKLSDTEMDELMASSVNDWKSDYTFLNAACFAFDVDIFLWSLAQGATRFSPDLGKKTPFVKVDDDAMAAAGEGAFKIGYHNNHFYYLSSAESTPN
jgi:hypothetical protein